MLTFQLLPTRITIDVAAISIGCHSRYRILVINDVVTSQYVKAELRDMGTEQAAQLCNGIDNKGARLDLLGRFLRQMDNSGSTR